MNKLVRIKESTYGRLAAKKIVPREPFNDVIERLLDGGTDEE